MPYCSRCSLVESGHLSHACMILLFLLASCDGQIHGRP